MTSTVRTRLEPAARGVLERVSPRHRRWRNLLDGCSLDPEAISAVDAPPAEDLIVCGCPRSGTALTAAALHRPPHTVTVMEPWDGLRLTPAALAQSLRADLSDGWLRRGRLDLDALDRGDVSWQRDGERQFAVPADGGTRLVVKWPSYWQLIGRLPTTRFVVTVRNPADVVASMARTGGRLSAGLDYDTTFTAALNQRLLRIDDVFERRLAHYDEVYGHVLDHIDTAKIHLVHYERWFSERRQVLAELGDFAGMDLMDSPVRITDHGRPRAENVARTTSTASRLGYS